MYIEERDPGRFGIFKAIKVPRAKKVGVLGRLAPKHRKVLPTARETAAMERAEAVKKQAVQAKARAQAQKAAYKAAGERDAAKTAKKASLKVWGKEKLGGVAKRASSVKQRWGKMRAGKKAAVIGGTAAAVTAGALALRKLRQRKREREAARR